MDTTKINYNALMEEEIARIRAEGRIPRLLLHVCCAPCASAVLMRLTEDFSVTVRYYNPNITDAGEYAKRIEELKRLIREMPAAHPVLFSEGLYEPDTYFSSVLGHEDDPEGGERCTICFRMRLRESAAFAKENNFDYFTTTLSISPLKDAQRLNRIGAELSGEYGVPYLFSDFKKKDGYRRSIELSGIYGLYRQDYCGCAFSKRERANQETE